MLICVPVRFKCGGSRRRRHDGALFCDYEASEAWTGPCPQCGRNYDIVRDRPIDDARLSLATLAMAKPPERLSTGCKEFDYVLGGGIVPGSTVILTGPPGTGKTTVLIQAAGAIATATGKRVLYTSGEQNKNDIGLFAARLGILNPNIDVLGNEGDCYKITAEAERRKPVFLVVDSAQTAFVPDVGGDVGSPIQIKAVANWLTSFGKVENVSVMLVSHVNKENDLAGPRALEHLVDAICYLEPYISEEDSEDEVEIDETTLATLREFVIGKNRFGPPGLRGAVEMTEKGLQTPNKAVSKRILLADG